MKKFSIFMISALIFTFCLILTSIGFFTNLNNFYVTTAVGDGLSFVPKIIVNAKDPEFVKHETYTISEITEINSNIPNINNNAWVTFNYVEDDLKAGTFEVDYYGTSSLEGGVLTLDFEQIPTMKNTIFTIYVDNGTLGLNDQIEYNSTLDNAYNMVTDTFESRATDSLNSFLGGNNE